MTEEPATINPRFTTRDDAVNQAILPTLDRFAHHYDVDAIFDAAFEYRSDGDRTPGFELAVSEHRYWAIVGQHDISQVND